MQNNIVKFSNYIENRIDLMNDSNAENFTATILSMFINN